MIISFIWWPFFTCGVTLRHTHIHTRKDTHAHAYAKTHGNHAHASPPFTGTPGERIIYQIKETNQTKKNILNAILPVNRAYIYIMSFCFPCRITLFLVFDLFFFVPAEPFFLKKRSRRSFCIGMYRRVYVWVCLFELVNTLLKKKTRVIDVCACVNW